MNQTYCLQVSLCTFGVYIVISDRNLLTAEKTFVSLSLFNMLRFPLLIFPVLINFLIQVVHSSPFPALSRFTHTHTHFQSMSLLLLFKASVALKRISKFLENDEIDAGSVCHMAPPEGLVAKLDNVTVSWDFNGNVPSVLSECARL